MAETKIERGQTLSSIAKKYGLSVQQLLAANPNIKDPNKISAGMKLNLPSAQPSAQTGTTTAADKFMKDASGRTIMGPNNAPIRNPSYSEEAANQRQLETIQEYSPAAGETVQQYADRMGLDPNVILEQNKGKGLSLGKPIPRGTNVALPQGFQLQRQPVQPESRGFLDTIKGAVGSIGETVGKIGDKSKEFLGEYGGLVGGAAQGLAAYKGYEASKEAREDYQKLLSQQLAETQAADREFQQQRFDPNRYAQEQKFLQERIAGGGVTPVEQKIQREGDIRAARMAAAARLSGLEQQARMGAGVAGAGSALASSLAGAQGLAGTLAQTNLEREASASERLARDISRTGALSTQETQEEADLAARQASTALQRVSQAGGTRGTMGEQMLQGGASQAMLYGRLADLAQAGIAKVAPPPKTDLEKAQEAAALAEAKAREAAARQLGSTPTQPVSQPAQQQPAARDKFNVQNVTSKVTQNIPKNLQAPVSNVVNKTAQSAQAAIDKKVEEGKKAVQGMVPKGLQGIFKF